MKHEESNEELDDILGEIYDIPPDHALVLFKDFKPWHHPRKHWVRVNQLCHLSQSLTRDSHFPDGTLRFLTLPGEELLDIQSLEGCEELLDIQSLEGTLKRGKAQRLKYIGFNLAKQNPQRLAMQNYAEGVLADRETIDPDSSIVDCKVEEIANTNSFAYTTVRDNGPFNVINLDLCNSIANKEPDHDGPTYFDAIARILELQRDQMAQPFIIFIATRSGINEINQRSLQLITKAHRDNITGSVAYKNAFERAVEERAEELLQKVLDGQKICQDVLNKIFGVGIGKWLLHLVKNTQPHLDVTLEHVCCYSVHDEKPNMLTLAFKFKRPDGGMLDKIGLSKILPGTKKILPEAELAIGMIQKSNEIVNVDTLLMHDTTVREKVITQSATLLAGIGYSEDNYRKWANAHFASPDEGPTAQ